MAGKEIAVKKYVVRLDAAERDQLTTLIHKGKGSAQLLTKARILLKADVSDLGEGWSDSRIAAALDTSIATIHRAELKNILKPHLSSPRRAEHGCRGIIPSIAIVSMRGRARAGGGAYRMIWCCRTRR